MKAGIVCCVFVLMLVCFTEGWFPKDKCNGVPYDTRRQMCCHKKVNYRPRYGGSCCYQSSYSSVTQMCCLGKIQRRPGTKSSCCFLTAYNEKTKICCNGRIQHRPAAGASCCGSQSYDTVSKICCQNVIQPKPSVAPSCCNDKAYSGETEICYGGILKERPPCSGTKGYIPLLNRCCEHLLYTNPSWKPQCCAEVFCGRSVLPFYYGLCGRRQLYNKHAHKCVNGVLIAISYN